MALYQPPPTWASVILLQQDPATGEQKPTFSPVWLKWFVDLAFLLQQAGGGSGAIGDVIGPPNSDPGNIAAFADNTGKLLADTGINIDNVVIGPATAPDGNLAVFSGTTGKLIADGEKHIYDVLTGTDAGGPVVGGEVPVYADSSGRVLQTTPVMLHDLVRNSTGSTTGNVAVFSDTSGVVIEDGGSPPVIGGNFVDNEEPTGTPNGVLLVFTLAFAPAPASSLMLQHADGSMYIQGIHYTLSSVTITFDAASCPQTGDELRAFYRKA